MYNPTPRFHKTSTHAVAISGRITYVTAVRRLHRVQYVYFCAVGYRGTLERHNAVFS